MAFVFVEEEGGAESDRAVPVYRRGRISERASERANGINNKENNRGVKREMS